MCSCHGEVLLYALSHSPCYGAENCILDDNSLDLLNWFQSELGKCILRLSRFHSHHAPLLALSWPSMTARIHLIKLRFLSRLLSSEHDTLASRTFHTLASQDIYSLSIVQQCIFLDSKLGTNATASILCNTHDPKVHLRRALKTILDQDNRLKLQHATQHQSVKLDLKINWLGIWETARDKGPYWTRITQSFLKVLTYPRFGECCCPKCSTTIPSETSYSEHLVEHHCP